jgi:hypothetical protein
LDFGFWILDWRQVHEARAIQNDVAQVTLQAVPEALAEGLEPRDFRG